MSIENYIIGSEKLTSIYRSWPTFHEPEVLQITLSRDEDPRPGKTEWNGPSLTVKFHLFIEAPTSRETIATIHFGEIEDIRLEGFNHQNAILSLKINEDSSHGRVNPQYKIFGVKIEEAFGISASFHCHTIEVLEASLICN